MIHNPLHHDPLALLELAVETEMPVVLTPAQAVAILKDRMAIIQEKNELVRLHFAQSERPTTSPPDQSGCPGAG